jgi:two-component system, OmpR family, copper resistance phosphate regulon response regulator CusR
MSTTPLLAAQLATILCIDDESVALAVRKRVLESAGYRVVAARSAEEGIRIFRTESFNLVVCDYWMPSMNGIAAAREIKRISPSVPLIILSGLSQLPDETIGIADRWILKDEGPEFLLSTIGTLLKDTL